MTIETADLFAGVVPFVRTAEARGFRRAAAELGVSPAAVSKAVARLEERLGVRLLARTSRSVTLTPEGAAFLERCREAIAHLRAGREAAMSAQGVPQGALTVTLPFILGPRVVPLVARLSARHAALSFHLRFTDRMSRLVEEGVDVAIRIGDLPDSSFAARRLSSTRWVTLAAPTHLARAGTPKRPADLSTHNCLRFVGTDGKLRDWTFLDGPRGRATAVRVRGNFDVDQGERLLDAAIAGLGICQVLDFMVAEPIRDGRLVEVLGDLAAPGPPIHAVSPAGRKTVPRVRALVDFLAEELGR